MSTPHDAPYKLAQRRFRALAKSVYHHRGPLGNKAPSRRDCHRAAVKLRKLNGC